jgi:hypothetical protein
MDVPHLSAYSGAAGRPRLRRAQEPRAAETVPVHGASALERNLEDVPRGGAPWAARPRAAEGDVCVHRGRAVYPGAQAGGLYGCGLGG